MLLFRRPVTRYGGFLWPASHSYGFSDKGLLMVTLTLPARWMGLTVRMVTRGWPYWSVDALVLRIKILQGISVAGSLDRIKLVISSPTGKYPVFLFE